MRISIAPRLLLVVLLFSLICAGMVMAAGETVNVSIGTLPAGKSITIIYDVTVNDPLPPGTSSFTQQGTVSGSNFSSVLTDDPKTIPVPLDPTVTQLGNELPVAGFGRALGFDGVSSQYVLISDAGSLNSSAYTVEAWVKFNTIASTAILQRLDLSGNSSAFGLYLDGNGNFVHYANDGTEHLVTGTTIAEAGKWYHVAGTFNNTTGTLQLFVDGVEEGSAVSGIGGLTGPMDHFTIGRSFAGHGESYLNGQIDEVRIWNAALTESGIADWMYRGLDSSNINYSSLAAYYKLDDGSGSTANDSAAAFDGALQNMTNANWVASTINEWYTDEDVAFSGRLVGSDSDGASTNGTDWALTFELVTDGTKGHVVIGADNSFTYTPNANDNGDDTFTYRVKDAASEYSNDFTVTVHIASVPDVPLISKAFGAASIPLSGSTTLTFTVTNPDPNTSLSGIAFSDTLPSGLVIGSPAVVSATCVGTITAPEGFNVISMTVDGLAANTSCNFIVNVTGTAAGIKNNTTSNVTSNESVPGGTASASIFVVAPPVIAKAFGAASIPLNGSTSLTFTITNPAANEVALTEVAFTDLLPAGIVVSTPNNLSNTCGGTPSAVAGSGSVTLTGGTIAVSSSCTIVVNVTGTALGNYTNITGNVTSTNGGTGNTGTANLSVATPPTITKAFGAASIPLNGSTALTFTITNPAENTISLTGLAFIDNLPAGLVVSTPNNLSNTCGGAAAAVAGSGSISLSGGTLAINTSCTLSVNVTGTTAGVKNNSIQVSSAEGGTGNTSNASITVVEPPVILKAFGAASIPLGGSTSLSFTIQNNNTTTTLTSIAFTDNLPAGLVVSSPSGLSGSCGGGTITAISGTNFISMTGAALAQSSSCTLSVNVTGTTAGTKNNTTGAVSSTNGGTGGTASASIDVVAPPSIDKAFGAPTITVNGTTSMTFTLTNPAANAVAETGVAFTDTLPAGMVVATPNGLVNNCGGTAIAVAGSGSVSLTGGTIAGNTSCTIVVNVRGAASGVWTNTTGAVSSANGGTGNTATANLTVAAPPGVLSHFTGPEFAYIANEGSNDVWAIDLATDTVIGAPITVGTHPHGVAAHPAGGRAYVGNFSSNTVSVIDTTTNGVVPPPIPNHVGGVPEWLAFSPDGSRIYFTNYTNPGFVSVIDTASNSVIGSPIAVGANPHGIAVHPSGSRVYVVNIGGNSVSVIDTATGSVVATIPGLNGPRGVAMHPDGSRVYVTCGANTVSVIDTVTNNIIGSPITVGVTPWGIAVAPDGSRAYVANNSSNSVSVIDTATNTVIGSPISVAGDPPVNVAINSAGTKVYVTQLYAPNGMVSVINTATNIVDNLIYVGSMPYSYGNFIAQGAATVRVNNSNRLSFNIQNPNINVALSGLSFTDNLPAGLVVATPANLVTDCSGIVTANAGATTISLSGGALASEKTCSISVDIEGVTAGVKNNSFSVASTEAGSSSTSTSTITVVGPPAISKAFGSASIPLGGSTTLTFSITNGNAVANTGIAFSDTLPSGLVISTPNGLTGACGGGTITATDGSDTISLSDATLAAGASCTFSVNVTGITAGTKNNTTGAISSIEGGTGATASASIDVVAPPSIAKSFGAVSIPLNGSTSLHFTITNPAVNAVAETGVAFTDSLPAGMVVATPPGLIGSCGGGVVTAVADSSSISLTGGTIAVNSSCTLVVNVTGTTAGTKNNVTGNVSSTNGGTGGTASANIAVAAPPTITKVFGAASIPLSGSTSLTFTITNPSANTIPLTGIAFTDNLPAGLVVSTPNALTSTCGGTATAVAGASSASLTGATLATNASCTLSVNITGTTVGLKNNSVQATSTESGTGSISNASIMVVGPPVISKAFGAAKILLDGSTSLSFIIQNANNVTALIGVGFIDTLPAGLVVSAPNGLSGTCGGGTITAADGSGSINLSGATLDALTSCTFSLNVTGTTAGLKDNSVTVTSTNGGTGNTSSASVTVVGPPLATDATDITKNSFSSNWNASEGATGYRLDVATDSGFGSFVTGFNDLDVGNVTTYSVASGLLSGKNYYYRVRAYFPGNTTESSNTIKLTTLGGKMSRNSWYLSPEGWILRAYTKADAPNEVYLEVMDTGNVVVPATGIAGMTGNPMLIASDAVAPEVALGFNRGTRTAHVTYTSAGGRQVVTVPGIRQAP